jgi:hypothetical protein
MKACKYLGVAENHKIENKNEKKVEEGVSKETEIDFENRAERKK